MRNTYCTQLNIIMYTAKHKTLICMVQEQYSVQLAGIFKFVHGQADIEVQTAVRYVQLERLSAHHMNLPAYNYHKYTCQSVQRTLL